MEREFLLRIHAWASPTLDGVFLVSHYLGTAPFCALVVVSMMTYSWRKACKRETLCWLVVGLSTFFLQWGLKIMIGRPRPDLWVGPVHHATFAMPSGHALAAATFCPLLARAAARAYPEYARGVWAAAAVMTVFIGFGRCYLGVHWPSDVLVGWSMGALQAWLAFAWLKREPARAVSGN